MQNSIQPPGSPDGSAGNERLPRRLPSGQPPPDGPPLVLLVDDDPIVRRSFSLTLRHAGLHVVEEETVVGAISRLAELRHTLDAMVVDHRLSPGFGSDVIWAYRHAGCGCGVLLFTGFPEEGARIARIVGADDFLQKGASADIVERVRRVAETGRWRRGWGESPCESPSVETSERLVSAARATRLATAEPDGPPLHATIRSLLNHLVRQGALTSGVRATQLLVFEVLGFSRREVCKLLRVHPSSLRDADASLRRKFQTKALRGVVRSALLQAGTDVVALAREWVIDEPVLARLHEMLREESRMPGLERRSV